MDKKEDIYIKIERLEAKIIMMQNEMGRDKQRISELHDYIHTKEKGRGDFDYFSIQLRKELLKRGNGMDYKSVSDFFHFSAQEAYRVMDRASRNFPFEIEVQKIKNGAKRKKIVILKRDRIKV